MSDAETSSRWGNVSLEKRIADRIIAILFAADQIRDMIALAVVRTAAPLTPFDDVARQIHDITRPLLPLLKTFNPPNDERDPELEAVLLQLDADMSRLLDRESGVPAKDAWSQLDALAAPYAVAFYFEIRRLDHLYLLGSVIPRDRK